MAQTVIGRADGYIIIDSKIRTDGIADGISNLKGQFAGMARSAAQTGSAIQNAFTGQSVNAQYEFATMAASAESASQEIINEMAELRNYLALSAEQGIPADYPGVADATARLQELEALYIRAAEARRELTEEVEDAAKDQIAAEKKVARETEKATEKAEKAHTKANKKSEKATKRSSKTMDRFGSRLSGIAMSAFLFNSLSAGFRNIAEYIGNAITSTDGMKQALANLKGAAQQAAAPIIQAITPALTALANAAATAVSYVAQLFAAFSGKSVSELGKSAKALNQNAKAAGKLSRSVAGFDQLTKLQDNSGGGGGEIEPNYDFIAEPVDFLEMMKQQILNGDWFGAGETLQLKINEMLDSIDWQAVGKKIGEIVGGIFSFALGLAVNVDPFQLMDSLSGLLAGLFHSLSAVIQRLDWADIGKKLVKAILFGVLMADPLAAIITIFSSPNGDDLARGAAEFIGSLVSALVSAIVGMAKEIGRIATELWDSIKSYFDEYVDWEGTPGEIIAGLFQGIIDALKNVGQWIKENIFQPFLDGWKKAWDINSPSGVMEEQGGFIMEGLFNGLLGGLARLGEICTTLWTTITDAFAGLGQWFETTFSDAWDAVLDIFSGDSATFEGIKESFATTFKEVFNNLVEGINKVIRTPFNSINSMLNKIREISVFGTKPFSGLWSYNPISVPQIPYLAKGAVIPPRAPFYAVLGDQRHGMNIEAPEGLIRSIFQEEMANMIGGMMTGFNALVEEQRNTQEIIRNIEVGDSTIGEAANRYAHKMAIMRGG